MADQTVLIVGVTVALVVVIVTVAGAIIALIVYICYRKMNKKDKYDMVNTGLNYSNHHVNGKDPWAKMEEQIVSSTGENAVGVTCFIRS